MYKQHVINKQSTDTKIKIMIRKIIFIATVFIINSVLISCNKDDIKKPVITIHELGDGASHGNDYTAKVGGDLHMDIDIVADGKIDYIQVKIHPEGEHHKAGGEHEEWGLDTTYTNYSGLKNTTFHEHVEIDTTAEAGAYHFDFIVTDLEGNQSSAEAQLQIIED